MNDDQELAEELVEVENTAPPPPPPSPEERAKSEVRSEFDLNVAAAPEVDALRFDVVKRHDKKTVQLLANSGSNQTFTGKRIWFNYEFTEPCFIEEIVIDVEDYSSYSYFDFAYVTIDGQRHEDRLSPANGEIRRTINEFAREVAFRPPRRQIASGRIGQITIFGFAQSETGKFGLYANSLEEKRQATLNKFSEKEKEIVAKLVSLKALEDSRKSIEDEIKAGEKAIEEIQDELRKLKSQREDTVTRITSLEKVVSDNNQRIEDQKNNIGEVSDIRSKLARSIIEKEAKLKSLTDNINLFPSELSDFVSQGARDVRLYAILAAIPIIVIAAMFGILVSGGVDLTTKITGEENVNILAILVSRMPFVIVAATVVTACYYLSRMFILEMVRVNRQKLSLSKIGIIAKDISSSVENELDISADEKYARRLTLKMDMLRDHLKDYLSKDFEPSLPKRTPFEQATLPGFAPRRSSKLNDDDEDIEAEESDVAENEDEAEKP